MLFVFKDLGKDMYLIATCMLIVAAIISFTLHEFAHAFVAYRQGDDTPKIQGRLNLNPLNHIDPIGFLAIMLVGFGWARPVQVNPIKFKKYRSGMIKVSLAGICVNLILAFISSGISFLLLNFAAYNNFAMYGYLFFDILFTINVTLAVFNFIPVFPLDGFNFIDSITKSGNQVVEFLRNYGQYILLFILIMGSDILTFLVSWISMGINMFWWGLFF